MKYSNRVKSLIAEAYGKNSKWYYYITKGVEISYKLKASLKSETNLGDPEIRKSHEFKKKLYKICLDEERAYKNNVKY